MTIITGPWTYHFSGSRTSPAKSPRDRHRPGSGFGRFPVSTGSDFPPQHGYQLKRTPAPFVHGHDGTRTIVSAVVGCAEHGHQFAVREKFVTAHHALRTKRVPLKHKATGGVYRGWGGGDGLRYPTDLFFIVVL